MSEDATLTAEEVRDARLPHWQVIDGALQVRYDTARFATGLDLVNRIGAAAEAADHHPDIDLRYGHVALVLVSHDAGGLTQRDIDLARTIAALATEAGVAAVDA